MTAIFSNLKLQIGADLFNAKKQTVFCHINVAFDWQMLLVWTRKKVDVRPQVVMVQVMWPDCTPIIGASLAAHTKTGCHLKVSLTLVHPPCLIMLMCTFSVINAVPTVWILSRLSWWDQTGWLYFFWNILLGAMVLLACVCCVDMYGNMQLVTTQTAEIVTPKSLGASDFHLLPGIWLIQVNCFIFSWLSGCLGNIWLLVSLHCFTNSILHKKVLDLIYFYCIEFFFFTYCTKQQKHSQALIALGLFELL